MDDTDVMLEPGDARLQDRPHRGVDRVGATVRRPWRPTTETIHGLLRHLRATGFAEAPEPIGRDDEGREVLSYIDGVSGADGWAKVVPDAGLARFARLLRRYHDAVAGFTVPATAVWNSPPLPSPAGELIVCHGDFGPWNIVWRGDDPVGVIDWDEARPGPFLYDVAYALEYTAPFRSDDECMRSLRYPAPPDRRHRIEVFADAYGLDDTTGLAGRVIDVQREGRRAVADLAAKGRQPQALWVDEGHLDELDARIAWSEAHRHLF